MAEVRMRRSEFGKSEALWKSGALAPRLATLNGALALVEVVAPA